MTYRIIRKLEPRRDSGGKLRGRASAQCENCGEILRLASQNVARSNKESRPHCPVCRDENKLLMSKSRPYRIWMGMKNRITREKDRDYPRYGGRGLDMDPAWEVFDAFWEEMCDGYFDGATIDRINNERGYWPDNCRWATNLQQQRNKSNNRWLEYKGKAYTIRHLSGVLGMSRCALEPRLAKGMTVEAAEKDYHSRARRPRIKYKGLLWTLRGFSEKTGISRCALSTRMKNGMSATEAAQDYWTCHPSTTSSTAGRDISFL